MEAVDQLEPGSDVLDAVQAASAELSQFTGVADVVQAALELSLRLTKSSVSFIALTDEITGEKQVFSRAADPDDALPQDEIERLFATAAAATTWGRYDSATTPAIRSYCGRPLVAGGKSIGMIGVASTVGYTAFQQLALGLFANQVAASIELARLSSRRQEMVQALVNLRSELDRSERQRLINEERAKAAERVERAHEAAVDALLAVSRHARSGHGLREFYRRLTRSIGGLVAARRVLFWQLNAEGFLVPIPGAYGIDNSFIATLKPVPSAPDQDDLASRIVYHDLMFRATNADEAAEFDEVFGTQGTVNAIAVPWRAGDQRLGLVAAYESRRSGGFSREDTWVLQKAGLAAGLVWQLQFAETDLRKTVERLERVDAARQMLLRNVTTAVEKARKHFAGELHDDALQKLTAAELQLQRAREPDAEGAAAIHKAQTLLAETEESLRRLLFEVRPPALEMAGGFLQTLQDRIHLVRSLTGAEVEADIEIPDDLSHEYRSMLFRQITEALANVEKHAAAKRVEVSLKTEDGGIRGRVADNGRGFVVAERERLPGHLGLLALNERALMAGGWNKVESNPGVGTTVEFWLPLDIKA
ncbi:MAG TPA: ATP-binding protein [Candidatus Dormibacteraeota bacterium]|nr:ATP-binding protein [Candidatus Dormibacteraeota bacterium]